MINLLEETKNVLAKHRHTLADINFILSTVETFDEVNRNFVSETKNAKVTQYELEKKLDCVYDNGYGGVEVNSELKLVGKDFWLERQGCAGSEWWEYKEMPAFNFAYEAPIEDLDIKEERL